VNGSPEVLVADDSRTARMALSMFVGRWGFVATQAADGDEAWERLQAPGAPRLALLDWEMPGRSGIEVCRALREREARGAAYTYVLLLTSRRHKHDFVAGMDAGADDYVVKPFDEHELRARVRAGQRVVALQAELYRLQESFRVQSRTDPLTGTLNRRAIVERLEAELSRVRREGGSLGVGMVDVDHFKRINDGLGHAAGDAVLCEIARRIEAGMRGSDAYGRTGGEEFLVLWPGADDAAAAAAADRARRLVAGAPFATPAGPVAVTASVGVTSTDGEEPADTVVARADRALYAAKLGGRDRVEVAGRGGARLAAGALPLPVRAAVG
jgi:diguanylate cyclase (GGDEF)-like protein